MTQYSFVGLDVAKDKFDVAIKINGRYKHTIFPNNPAGHEAFIEWLTPRTKAPWVCMEATGHYSTLIADYLVKHGLRASVINPFQIKNFAKATLARNKNDTIDAKIISQFSEKMEPRIYKARPKEQKEISELTKVFDMLKTQLLQLSNQLHSITGKEARKALERLIKKLEKDIVGIENKIAGLIRNNCELNQKLQLLTSITGIGKLTAFRIIALMPDVSLFEKAKQFAAYIGITPKQNLSGTFVGRTTISRMGDARLRKSLYMASMVAKRHNKALSGFINRLQDKGKTPKTIICAVMRKLAHIIFAVLKNKQPFNQNYA